MFDVLSDKILMADGRNNILLGILLYILASNANILSNEKRKTWKNFELRIGWWGLSHVCNQAKLLIYRIKFC